MAKYNEVPTIQNQIAELERRMLEMETSTRFTTVNLTDGTSIQVRSGGVINVTDGGEVQVSDESAIFVGDAGRIEVGTGGDINLLAGSQLTTSPGSELISGGLLQVLGNLSLPTGIIDNAALASPITVNVAPTVTRTAWPVTAALANLAWTFIPVPEGFTQALVFGIGSINFQDTTPNWLESRIVINDLIVGTLVRTQTSNILSTTIMHSQLLTGLSDQIRVEIEMRSEHDSSDNDGRAAQVTGFAVFFR